jgi:hypothetical protein
MEAQLSMKRGTRGVSPQQITKTFQIFEMGSVNFIEAISRVSNSSKMKTIDNM